MNYGPTHATAPTVALNPPSDSLGNALSAIDDQRSRLPSLIDRLARVETALCGPTPAVPSAAEKAAQPDSLVWQARATADGLGRDIQHMSDVLDSIERAIGL